MASYGIGGRGQEGNTSHDKESKGRRYVVVEDGIIHPTDPRPRNVKPKLPGDYPQVPKVYLDAAVTLSSPLLTNPPLCDELVAFVQHLWTEEEASLVRHLHPFRGTSCAELARARGEDGGKGGGYPAPARDREEVR